MVIQEILDRLRAPLDRWCREKGLEGPKELALSAPPSHIRADLSTGLPLQLAKRLKVPPPKVAQELAGFLQGPMAGLAETSFAPPGFLNFILTPGALAENLVHLATDTEGYGRLSAPPADNYLFEFVSANPTGPLHMASGRAATLGDSLVRILRRLGYRADGEYYINDYGRQVRLLGESLKARFKQRKGSDDPIPEGGYQGEYLVEMAEGLTDQQVAEWGWDDSKFSRYAVHKLLESHKKDMEEFGCRFDRWFLESELHDSKADERTLDFLRSKGLVYDKDGAVWLGTSKDGEDDKDRVLRKASGENTYFLTDIAYHYDKLKRGYTKVVDIWGADHHGYVPRMRAAIEALGYPDAFHPIVHQLVHLYRGTEAVKMSKRSGQFVTLRELMEEVGVDACRFFFAMRTPNSHLNFDLELAKKKSQENPVYYVQYVHARIRSIFSEAEKRGLRAPERAAARKEPLSLLKESEERGLLLKMAWFPQALQACVSDLSPHHLTTYLTELAGLFHPFYEKHRVADEKAPELSQARLRLCWGVGEIIRQGLGLLGVSAPERM